MTNTFTSIMGIGDVGFGTTGAQIALNTDGTLELGFFDGGYTQIGSDSSALSEDTWYRIELMYDDSTDTAEAKINGVTFASGAATDIGSSTDIFFGGFNDCTTDIYYDDMAVNDTTGTAQTSWPGSGKVVHMQPNAAGDNNNASAGDYTSVDEITPDDATSIAVLNDNGDILDVNLESSADAGIGASDNITLVQVGAREAAALGAQESFVLRIKSQAAGTLLESGTITHDDVTYKTVGMGEGNFFGYQLTSYVDPQAGGAWTPALLDTAQIGMRAVDADPDINLSTLWALVEYVEVVAGAANKLQHLSLLGVG